MVDKVLKIVKTDLVTGEEIEGAELQVVDEDGNIIDEWTSTKEALFKLQPYAVHLLNKYMKFLRDHYMAGGIGVRTNEQQPELIQ